MLHVRICAGAVSNDRPYRDPAENGIGFEDYESIFPMLNAAGEPDEPEAIGLSEARFLDFALKDDRLLAEEKILGDELKFASRKISGCERCNRLVRRLRKMEEGLF